MEKKIALVTGASRGIGKAIALKFAQEGYHIFITCYRRHSELTQTQEEIIEKFHVSCDAYVCDAGYRDACEDLFWIIQKQYGTLDVLVNNAGVSYIGLLQDMSFEDWDHVLSSNLTSVFNCCKLAIPMMLRKGHGKIVNISSVWGNVGASCEVAYSATKGGVNTFTRALARELAPSNIQVNAVACGAIDTDMNKWMEADERQALLDEIPAGRMGNVEEVADLVYHLCCGHTYLTGQIIGLNGGWM